MPVSSEEKWNNFVQTKRGDIRKEIDPESDQLSGPRCTLFLSADPLTGDLWSPAKPMNVDSNLSAGCSSNQCFMYLKMLRAVSTAGAAIAGVWYCPMKDTNSGRLDIRLFAEHRTFGISEFSAPFSLDQPMSLGEWRFVRTRTRPSFIPPDSIASNKEAVASARAFLVGDSSMTNAIDGYMN